MDLVVEEFKTKVLKQEMEASSNQLIEAVRPHLYVHNTPSGSFTVTLENSDSQVFATSNTIAISTVSATNFFHGYIKFDFDAAVHVDDNFFVAITMSGGYTFAEANYVGWCKDFDLRKYTPDFTPNVGFSSALDLEIWGKQFRTRG